MKSFFVSISAFLLLSTSLQAATLVDDLAKKLSVGFQVNGQISESPSFRFLQTPKNSWLIGLRQLFLVHASPARVSAVLDNVKEYTGIFSDLKRAEFEEYKSANEYTIFTETQVNFPFVPNDQTALSYKIERGPKTILYRYSLKKSNSVKSYDGLILLAATKEGETIYYEYDSFEPDLGIAKAAGEQKVWVESALGNLQSDWAIKLRAEHPDWSASKVLSMSEEKVSDARRPFKKLFEEKGQITLDGLLDLAH